MFSSPLVRHFLLDKRVQERKGLHAFFLGIGPKRPFGANPHFLTPAVILSDAS